MAQTYTDPVCAMKVTPATAEGKSEYKGEDYYFCSVECKIAFDRDPERYIEQREEIPA